MSLETLPLESTKILNDCPRLRVLVVGKSGTGKSSLISIAFGVTMKSVSHIATGESDVNEPIESDQNPRFVLHDSMGFEPNETKNLEHVTTFLKARSDETVALKDRVHIIWLCIRVPHAGGRVLETGDELLLELAFKLQVPVVVVFTQYDVLLNAMYLRLRKGTNEERIKAAEENFQDLCIKPLQDIKKKLLQEMKDPVPEMKEDLPYARTSGLSGGPKAKPNWDALDEIIKTTRELIEKRFGGEAWIVSAMAQRTSVEEKINGAIAVGMQNYWKGLATGSKFLGYKLETCLNTVHKEMTDSWNLYDPDDLLQKEEFLKKMRTLAQLVTPKESDAKSWWRPNFDQLQTIAGFAVAAGVAAFAVVPLIAGIGLSVYFLTLLATTYNESPETLRCFMGYIIDLSLVMDQLFHITIARSVRPLTNTDIDEALENYKNARLGAVHREIRTYAGKASIQEIVRAGPAEKKMQELIRHYSFDLRAGRGTRKA
ncbi:hypothetical protein C8F04DRAFT_1137329 [Mycena alexandri]|uniref:G domain-containing protein n=1 Tax=Mycena alexandri TaxID=1745969 RepID=A0AAD6SBT6_9AGAR|nr:hypothetical protein C8F04DRAFT_1137329 [Mycena alexandri]